MEQAFHKGRWCIIGQFTKSKPRFKVIKIDPNKKMCDPKPFTVLMINENSLSKEYDKARFEWDLKDYKNETSEGFSNICQLCGNPHLKHNFIIHNPNTNKYLSVGSTCIIRFGVVKGNIDVESGTQIVKNFMKEREHYFYAQSLVKGMMARQPDAKDFQTFYKSLKKILESKNLTKPTVDELGEICYGERWIAFKEDSFVCERLRLIWYRPMIINDMTVKSKVKKDKQIKEGTTFGHKSRTSVYIPGAARSEAFKTDRISD